MSELLDQYRKYAADHGRYTEEGKDRQTNDSYRELERVLSALVKAGRGNEIVYLFNDADPWVQVWAATHALDFSPADAIKKLEELAERPSHIGSTAKYVLMDFNQPGRQSGP